MPLSIPVRECLYPAPGERGAGAFRRTFVLTRGVRLDRIPADRCCGVIALGGTHDHDVGTSAAPVAWTCHRTNPLGAFCVDDGPDPACHLSADGWVHRRDAGRADDAHYCRPYERNRPV